MLIHNVCDLLFVLIFHVHGHLFLFLFGLLQQINLFFKQLLIAHHQGIVLILDFHDLLLSTDSQLSDLRMELGILILKEISLLHEVCQLIRHLAMLLSQLSHSIIQLFRQLNRIYLILLQLFDINIEIVIFLLQHCILVGHFNGQHLFFMLQGISGVHQFKVDFSFGLNLFLEALVHFVQIDVVLSADLFVFHLDFSQLPL